MIKATRSEQAAIGALPVGALTLKLTGEHFDRLCKILRETHQTPSDWLATLLNEECQRIGIELPSGPDEPEDTRQQDLPFDGKTFEPVRP